MAEVVDWSPVDDDNDSAPPVGAPEGMMPSAVNNTLRAMMASLRRMYDKPYLPTAGGTVTGNVAINGTGGLALSGVQLRNISSSLEVYHASGGFVASRGPGAGYVYGDRDQVSATWTWYANGGLSYLHNTGTGNVLNVSDVGALAMATSVDTPTYKMQGTLFAQRSVDNATLIYDGDGQLALALYGTAGLQASFYRADAHNFQNNALSNTVTINSLGDLAATRHVSAAGNITAGGQISGALLVSTNDISATDAISAGGTISGATVTASGVLSSAGTLFIAGNGEINGTLAVGGTVFATGFTDTNGFVVVTELQALMARVAALEAQATGGSHV